MVDIYEGQIWREDDHAQPRHVKVVQVLGSHVRIVACDWRGKVDPKMRTTQADKRKFGKKGGYLLVSGLVNPFGAG